MWAWLMVSYIAYCQEIDGLVQERYNSKQSSYVSFAPTHRNILQKVTQQTVSVAL